MALLLKVPSNVRRIGNVGAFPGIRVRTCVVRVSMETVIPVMVNSCTGKMGNAVIEAAVSAGLHIVPSSFGSSEESGKSVQAGGKEIHLLSYDDREKALASIVDEYPNLIVVDYSASAAVNVNAELYSKVGVLFVIGTTGGDRDDSKVYAELYS